MKIRRPRLLVALSIVAVLFADRIASAEQAGPFTFKPAQLVDSDKLAALACPLVDEGWAYGLAVGLISEEGIQLAGYGRISETNDAPPGADTLFEIGSISKVFTGLLLAQMVEDGAVALTDPVQKLLGDSMQVSRKDDRQITLVDLATHSSGLPRMPTNFDPADWTNPYADYSVEQMAEFVSSYRLKRLPGARSEYSNLGLGLLGHALAVANGSTYESMLQVRICQPLGMHDTCITLTEDTHSRLAQPHDGDGSPAANWDIPTLAGAGAIRSTVTDMLRFLAANMGLSETPLSAAMAASHVVHFKNPEKATQDVALCWQVQRKPRVIWHNGQTGGYHAFAGFSPEKRVGVVLLCNTGSMQVDPLGFRLLTLLATGEAQPLELTKAIQLEPESLDPLLGTYALSLVAAATITREGDQLYLQITGQPKVRFYPESETKFFCRIVPAKIVFEAGDDGQIDRLVIHQGGQEIPANRAATEGKAAE